MFLYNGIPKLVAGKPRRKKKEKVFLPEDIQLRSRACQQDVVDAEGHIKKGLVSPI